MSKTKTVYVCQECGAESPKWIGKCPVCGQWNSYVEQIVRKEATASSHLAEAVASASATTGISPVGRGKPILIDQVEVAQEPRMDTGCEEFNRVLGGGLVPGSLTLIGGEPGIGKSTLVMQVVMGMRGVRTLYCSGEESEKQLRLRSERLGTLANNQCYIVSCTLLEDIFTHIKNILPDVVIIDSIQTISTEGMESGPGSISQVRECAAQILRFAKQSGIPVLLIGHINKEGNIAGPKVLEHIVDTVIQFEGDQHYLYRMLRSQKNRFGSTSEIGLFEMTSSGLRQVVNPSEMLLSKNHLGLSGTAIGATVEGIRPFLIEVQSLVSTAAYGTPQRSSTGFDNRRLNMLLAVLEKRVGFKLGQKDVFLNIAGGIKVNDPAMDLPVISAVLSSNMDLPLPADVCMAAEVGLTGELRQVGRIEQRINEAQKLGFRTIFVPDFKSTGSVGQDINIVTCQKVEDVFKHLFG